MFQPLASWCARLPTGRWPDLDDWNRLIASTPGLACGSGNPLRLVPQATDGAPENDYEIRAYQTGEVQTRSENWHDY